MTAEWIVNKGRRTTKSRYKRKFLKRLLYSHETNSIRSPMEQNWVGIVCFVFFINTKLEYYLFSPHCISTNAGGKKVGHHYIIYISHSRWKVNETQKEKMHHSRPRCRHNWIVVIVPSKKKLDCDKSVTHTALLHLWCSVHNLFENSPSGGMQVINGTRRIN